MNKVFLKGNGNTLEMFINYHNLKYKMLEVIDHDTNETLEVNYGNLLDSYLLCAVIGMVIYSDDEVVIRIKWRGLNMSKNCTIGYFLKNIDFKVAYVYHDFKLVDRILPFVTSTYENSIFLNMFYDIEGNPVFIIDEVWYG